MSLPTTGVLFSGSTPAAPPGNQLCEPRTDGGTPAQIVSFAPRLATAALAGAVRPDNTSLAVDANGVMSVIAPGTGGGGGGTSASGGLYVCVSPTQDPADGTRTQFILPAPQLAGTVGWLNRNDAVQRQLGPKAYYSVQGTQLTLMSPLEADGYLEYHYIQGTPDSESGGGGSVNPVTSGTFIQGAVGYVNGTSNPVAFISPNAAGSCLIVDVSVVELFGGAGTVSISDSAGNSYSSIINQEQNQLIARTWVALNCAGGANTVTVSYTGGGPINVAIHEYAGVKAASALDVSAYTQIVTPAIGSPLSVSVTTTVAGDLLHLFACSEKSAGGVTYTETGGWSSRETSNPSGGSAFLPTIQTWDSLAVTAATYSDSVATSGSVNLSCYLIALKPI